MTNEVSKNKGHPILPKKKAYKKRNGRQSKQINFILFLK